MMLHFKFAKSRFAIPHRLIFRVNPLLEEYIIFIVYLIFSAQIIFIAMSGKLLKLLDMILINPLSARVALI